MSVLEKKIKLCFKMQAGVSRCCKLRHVFMIESWSRGRSRANATSKMECFAIIVNGFQPLTIITKHCILDVAAALDPLLLTASFVSTRMLYLAREREEIFVSL